MFVSKIQGPAFCYSWLRGSKEALAIEGETQRGEGTIPFRHAVHATILLRSRQTLEKIPTDNMTITERRVGITLQKNQPKPIQNLLKNQPSPLRIKEVLSSFSHKLSFQANMAQFVHMAI